MKIELDQSEIHAALKHFIEDKGFQITDQEVDIQMIAGRGANGHYAQITLTELEDTPDDSSVAVQPNSMLFPPDPEPSEESNDATLDPAEPALNFDQ
ncbi:MAG: hypothetical protein DRH97_01440 [Chloroflexi bacterium]|nr:MAG: hypothetical protein DRH97_01440 [Chloroflexota bacterium]